MSRMSLGRTLAVAVICSMSATAFGQARGRTDGPEGSEYGKGGYSRSGSGTFSLTLDWGASMSSSGPLAGQSAGPPLFVGLTGSLWFDEWFVLDLSPSYQANDGRLNLLVGPRFRTVGWPVSAHAGLQAGPIIDPDVGVRFGLSPQVGLDTVLGDHYLMGLSYALDVPLGGDALNHRLFMKLGYRF